MSSSIPGARGPLSLRHDVGLPLGEPDFAPSGHVVAAAQEAAARVLGYSPANGLPELRRTARHLLERDRGLEYADAEVAVECGAKQVDTVEPDGAFYLLPRLATGDDLAVADALLEVGCATVPGNAFGAPGRLRLSFATDIAALEEGCRTLVDVLDEVIS